MVGLMLTSYKQAGVAIERTTALLDNAPERAADFLLARLRRVRLEHLPRTILPAARR